MQTRGRIEIWDIEGEGGGAVEERGGRCKLGC